MISLPKIFGKLRLDSAASTRALTLALIAPLAACGNTSVSSAPNDTAENASVTQTISPAVASAPQGSYADVVERVAPAVVTVNSTGRLRASRGGELPDDPILREFFGGRIPQQQPRRERGVGSGVIVSRDGYILTNNHVVDEAETIRVTLTDRRTYTAKVVGTDPATDLAVLKIEANNLPVLPLGDSEKVRVGDVALAIGNPLGLEQTVTSGIISAKGRATGAGSAESFEDFIQTDAPINRGNSGGALISTRGELIGINSQILSPTGGSIGIGFAIPSNMAKNVMDQLVKTGKVRRGYLGLGPQDISSDLAASLELNSANGVIVRQVEPNQPAARAGLRVGDIILALNNQPIADANGFRNRIASIQPGETVNLTIRRANQEQQIRATLGERPATVARNNEDDGEGSTESAGSPAERATTAKLGATLQPITPELAQRLSLREGAQGLVVTNIDPNGPAAEAGLTRGDIIQEINNQPVHTTNEISTAIARSNNRPVLMLVNRGGNTIFITVRAQQS